MQEMAINWTTFGYGLAASFVFGIVYAVVVRRVSKKGWIGQTAWSVVVGVTFTLITMLPAFGLLLVALVFCHFAAAGVPMIIEYLDRVQAEIQQDKNKAHELNKELLNDHQAPDR